MIRSVPVALGGRAYEVLIGEGLIDQAGERIAPLLKRKRTAVVADETVAGLHGARMVASLEKRLDPAMLKSARRDHSRASR